MNLVKQLREANGWTQGHLSGVSDVPVRTIQRVESGAVQPSAEVAMALADALGTTAGQISEWSGLRQRLRECVARWRHRSPSGDELKTLPEKLRPLFAEFHRAKAQMDEDSQTLQRLGDEHNRLHEEVMKQMDERHAVFLAACDNSVELGRRLQLMAEVKARQAGLGEVQAKLDEVRSEMMRVCRRTAESLRPMGDVAVRLDRELDAYGVFG